MFLKTQAPYYFAIGEMDPEKLAFKVRKFTAAMFFSVYARLQQLACRVSYAGGCDVIYCRLEYEKLKIAKA